MLFENILRKIVFSTKEHNYTECPVCRTKVEWNKKLKVFIISGRPGTTGINSHGYFYPCNCNYILKRVPFKSHQKIGYKVNSFFNMITGWIDKFEEKLN